MHRHKGYLEKELNCQFLFQKMQYLPSCWVALSWKHRKLEIVK